MAYLDLSLDFLPPLYARRIVWGARVGFVLVFLIITIMSLIPGGMMNDVNVLNIQDKLGHFLAYGLLAACGMVAAPSVAVRMGGGAAIALYGAFLEIMQAYFAWDRDGSWGDIIADVTGLVAGAVVAIAAVGLLRALPRH